MNQIPKSDIEEIIDDLLQPSISPHSFFSMWQPSIRYVKPSNTE